MDLTEIFEFWKNLESKHVFLALWGLLMVLFEIVHEWRLKETDEGKYVGMGMNPRRAILWHHTEFMNDAHIARIRTSLRRKLLHTGLQSVHSSIDSQQTRRQQQQILLQYKADEERKRTTSEAIKSFLKREVAPKIRLRQWSEPLPLPEPNHLEIDWKWPHWKELKSVAGKWWNEKGHHIEPKKRPFLRTVEQSFWEIVPTRALKPYHGSIADSLTGCLDQGVENDLGNIAMAAEQEDDLTAEREQNLKKVAEALNATDLLGKMSWLHDCPNTWQHWDCFVAIMDFRRERIRDQALESVKAFMQKPNFPSSMRAWSIMPWAALKELERRGQVSGPPHSGPKIAVRRFFANLSCHAVAAGRDS